MIVTCAPWLYVVARRCLLHCVYIDDHYVRYAGILDLMHFVVVTTLRHAVVMTVHRHGAPTKDDEYVQLPVLLSSAYAVIESFNCCQ